MKRISTLLLILFALSFACSLHFENTPDPRDGELGRLHFSGGGGCNSSTTLALGSTARLTMEPLTTDPLPQDLAPQSSAPEIISATRGEDYNQLVLKALREGRALVEIYSAGQVYDQLEFFSAPAFSAKYTVVGEVFAGGHLAVKVDEIYGECGTDCPLIGGDFMAWSGEPTEALELESYQDRTAIYVTKAAGMVRLIGREQSASRVLVDHSVEVLPADQAGSIRCKSTVVYPGEDALTADQCPLLVRVGAMMLLELAKLLEDGRLVAIAAPDIRWEISGDTDAVILWPYEEGQPPPEGHIFLAQNPGQVTLTADIPLTGDRFSCTLTVGQ